MMVFFIGVGRLKQAGLRLLCRKTGACLKCNSEGLDDHLQLLDANPHQELAQVFLVF